MESRFGEREIRLDENPDFGQTDQPSLRDGDDFKPVDILELFRPTQEGRSIERGLDMDRRIFLIAFIAVVAFGTGCNLMDRRPEKSESATTETSIRSSGLIDDLKVDSLAGAHAPGRSAGAWSSEAREIEGHFNVR